MRRREHTPPHPGHAVFITDASLRSLLPNGHVDLPHGCIAEAVLCVIWTKLLSSVSEARNSHGATQENTFI